VRVAEILQACPGLADCGAHGGTRPTVACADAGNGEGSKSRKSPYSHRNSTEAPPNHHAYNAGTTRARDAWSAGHTPGTHRPACRPVQPNRNSDASTPAG
jgi:hypothetical protein